LYANDVQLRLFGLNVLLNFTATFLLPVLRYGRFVADKSSHQERTCIGRLHN